MRPGIALLFVLSGCARPLDFSSNSSPLLEFGSIGDAGATADGGDLAVHAPLTDLAHADAPPSADLIGQCTSFGVVINEVKTGSTASASNEFIELYNPCASPVNLTGYQVVYRGAAATADTHLVTLSLAITGFGYLLLGTSAYSGTKDVTYTAGLAAAGGGVALKAPGGAVEDSVGWGTATNAFVETSAAAAPAVDKSIARKPNGVDTNKNAQDFMVEVTPTPRATN